MSIQTTLLTILLMGCLDEKKNKIKIYLYIIINILQGETLAISGALRSGEVFSGSLPKTTRSTCNVCRPRFRRKLLPYGQGQTHLRVSSQLARPYIFSPTRLRGKTPNPPTAKARIPDLSLLNHSPTHPLTHLLFFEILLVYFFIVLWSAANVVGAWTLLSRELRL